MAEEKIDYDKDAQVVNAVAFLFFTPTRVIT